MAHGTTCVCVTQNWYAARVESRRDFSSDYRWVVSSYYFRGISIVWDDSYAKFYHSFFSRSSQYGSVNLKDNEEVRGRYARQMRI